MQYLSTYYRPESSVLSLVLQQVTRQKGRVPILFAGLFERKEFAEHLVEWFYECALPRCEKKPPASCVDALQGLFWEKIRRLEREEASLVEGTTAMLLAMGEECFYAWRGEADIRLLNLCFDRMHVRSLTRASGELSCERAVWEPGTGLVLGVRDFFDRLPQEALKACLSVGELECERQAERHLAEAAREAERLGAGETAVLFAAARERGEYK